VKRLVAFVAVLCLAQIASAQSTIDHQNRAEALANTISAYQNRIPPSALEMDATLLPQKHLPAAEACTTYTLPDAGVLNGQHLWGVANQPMPNSHSCYILDDEPWDYWSVPVHPGEQITFALESNVRAYFSIETGSVFSGSSTLQPNGKWLTGYIWTVPATFSGTTARLA
jgi:hypothetical protein